MTAINGSIEFIAGVVKEIVKQQTEQQELLKRQEERQHSQKSKKNRIVQYNMNYFEAERNRALEPPSTSSMIPVTRYPGSFSAINTSKDNTTTLLKTPYV